MVVGESSQSRILKGFKTRLAALQRKREQAEAKALQPAQQAEVVQTALQLREELGMIHLP